MADPNEPGDYSDVVSRRKFVSIAGTTGAAAVAGCLDGGDEEGQDDGDMDGGDEEGQDGDDGMEGEEPEPEEGEERVIPESVDEWFDTAQTEHAVDTFHYNYTQYEGTTHVEFGIWSQYAQFDWDEAEFVPHLVEDWEGTETEFVLTLRDDITWDDGEPVDAEDLAFQWDTVLRAEGNPVFNFVDEVEATDDFELTFHYPEGTNQGIIEHAVLHEQADRPPADWEDFDPDEDGVSSWEVTDVTASGPLTLTETHGNYHQFEPRDQVDDADDHPFAENYNWNGYRMRHREDNQSAHNSLINQDLDGIHSLYVGDETLAEFPDTIQEMTFPGTFGLGMWFNHSDDRPFSDRSARQAVAHSIDLESVIQAIGEDKKIYHEAQTGMTEAAANEWLGSTAPEGFNTYEQDQEEVESLLEEADLTLGEVNPEFVVPGSWSDWVLMASQIVDQMEDIVGWNVDLNTESGGYWGSREEGNFDIIAMEHSDGPEHNHPYFSLEWKLVNSEGNIAAEANYEAADVDLDVEGTFEDLAGTQDEGEQEELTRELAQVVNEDLPYYHIAQKYEQSFIDREFWEFPDEHEFLRAQWPLWLLPKTDEELDDASTAGLLKAVEQ